MVKISIITATYNSQKHLPGALKSLSLQRYPHVEHIVIDGASKDKTLACLQENGKVDQLLSEPDNGLYDALNKGIKLATGDVIGFLHSDDRFASEWTLQHIADLFSENPELDMVYGDLVYVHNGNHNRVVRCWKSCDFTPRLLQRGWMPPHPTVFVRKEVYRKHGFFDCRYRISADYDQLLRILRDESLHLSYLPEVITLMQKGGESTGKMGNLIRKTGEDYLVIRNHNFSFPLWVLIMKNFSKLVQLRWRYLR